MLLSKSITVLTAALLSGSHLESGGIRLVQASPVAALSEEEVIEGVSLESDRTWKPRKVSFWYSIFMDNILIKLS